MRTPEISHNKPVVFYDGVCGLCNRSVQSILKKDKKNTFLFSPLQSTYAKEKLGESYTVSTIILYHQHQIYLRSDAIIKIATILGGIYKIAVIGYLIPKLWRDACYNYIANRRYKWFGKYDTCKLPNQNEAQRFIL